MIVMGGKGKPEMLKSKEAANVVHSSPPTEPPDSTMVIEEAAKEARQK